jgi:hypothetical protein
MTIDDLFSEERLREIAKHGLMVGQEVSEQFAQEVVGMARELLAARERIEVLEERVERRTEKFSAAYKQLRAWDDDD